MPWNRIAAHVESPAAPPAADVDRFWYGAAQPFLGLRVLLQTPALLKRALLPVAAVLVLAALVVGGGDDETGAGGLAWRYYATIVGLSSVPAVLFASMYARLAAKACAQFGFG